MTKSKALILGGCTVWPIVYMFLFMGIIFSQFMMMDFGGKQSAGAWAERAAKDHLEEATALIMERIRSLLA